MRLGDRLKVLRHQRGWSQHELARRARVRQATIADLESGISRETRTDVARRLARALGVTVDYLVGMYEDEEAEDAFALQQGERPQPGGGASGARRSSPTKQTTDTGKVSTCLSARHPIK